MFLVLFLRFRLSVLGLRGDIATQFSALCTYEYYNFNYSGSQRIGCRRMLLKKFTVIRITRVYCILIIFEDFVKDHTVRGQYCQDQQISLVFSIFVLSVS